MDIKSRKVASEDIRLSSPDNETRYKTVISWLLEYTDGNIEQLTNISKHLAQVDWPDILDQKHKEIQQELEYARSHDGGLCDRCNYIEYPLRPFFHAEKYTGKYCWNCVKDLEKMYDVSTLERIYPCDKCRGPFILRILAQPTFKINRFFDVNLSRGLCPTCLQGIIDKQTITCPGCGNTVLEHQDPEVCDDCYVKYPGAAIVSAHRGRARALGLPATLTLEEWTATVEHFQHKCAYCTKPYVVLEHFIPLTKGGGTTVDNCVPSCNRCNSRKGDLIPDAFSKIFPAENLARIRSWLAQQQTQEAAS